MFGFRKKKPAPPLCPANPGIGVEAKVVFSTGDRSRTEEVNLVSLAAEVLKQQGYSVVKAPPIVIRPSALKVRKRSARTPIPKSRCN